MINLEVIYLFSSQNFLILPSGSDSLFILFIYLEKGSFFHGRFV